MALTDFFTQIADSIRSKDGTTEPILATDFPQRIIDIPSGGVELVTYTPINNERVINVDINSSSAKFIFVFSSYGVVNSSYGVCDSLFSVGENLFGHGNNGALLLYSNGGITSYMRSSNYIMIGNGVLTIDLSSAFTSANFQAGVSYSILLIHEGEL